MLEALDGSAGTQVLGLRPFLRPVRRTSCHRRTIQLRRHREQHQDPAQRLLCPEGLQVPGICHGGGIAYGYAWILGRHLNLEAEIGVGYIYTTYDKFNCVGCGKRVLTGQPAHFVGPTKAAINFVYVF